MDDLTFWTAVGAAATFGAAAGAVAGVIVAWRQLRQISRAAGNDAVLRLYELFDEESHRANRRRIWTEIQAKNPIDLSNDEWSTLERTATEMDVIGTMLMHKLVRAELVFERYAEVIVPMWDAIRNHILYRRNQKGGFGWHNFEWLAAEARKWSQHKRGVTVYRRFQSKDSQQGGG